ncbi:hypothetical protein HHK36_007798 [Tetracentron sinense]|uniref:Uncharacterized protein n=1 Tax=Tetracentron sinense TaxID=13715 RepID=A0A835DJE9_TETSI|nr:hypothetical protein HHK36_007798 [Tetracentron sinense]
MPEKRALPKRVKPEKRERVAAKGSGRGGATREGGGAAEGKRYEWPELVGKNGESAKTIIEKDNPFVTAVVIPTENFRDLTFCCNRVWVNVDNKGNVVSVPRVG